MGEGGALLIRDKLNIEKAEIIREKGTNRSKYFRGEVDKYTWVDFGSSYLPSDINAAYLYAQLENADMITEARLKCYHRYYKNLFELQKKGKISLPIVPPDCNSNAHMFFLKCKNQDERGLLIAYLTERNIKAVFHYVPLHTSPAGKKFGRFHGEARFTTSESERLLRLPMYYGLSQNDVDRICDAISDFYKKI